MPKHEPDIDCFPCRECGQYAYADEMDTCKHCGLGDLCPRCAHQFFHVCLDCDVKDKEPKETL